jgi:cell division protein ZapE
MSPLERYQAHLARADITADPAQRAAVEHLQRLYDDLLARRARGQPGALQRLARRLVRRPERQPPVQGLYFWGGVGRGKTFLMDIFYESLPFEQKMRTHFHRFMRRVHEELRRLGGHKNPLEEVAEVLASEATVICFDEFFVADITDAMILAGLLDQLFARGVTLVTTSNIVPEELYRDGLQRVRFLPAIDLIKQHLLVVNVDGGVDYRLRALKQAELYHSPLDAQADSSLMRSFRSLAPEEGLPDQVLVIANRDIPVRWLADDVAWFDFRAVCDGPRSQNDYIEMAMEFHAVLISNVPCFDNIDDQARRFINLVDEFYDRNVKLVLSAAVPLDRLYQAGRLGFEFERTRSRLLEMQSHDYLAREHRA